MLALLFASSTFAQSWDYKNFNWGGKGFPLCDGSFQTPIDIDERSTEYHPGLAGLDWENSVVQRANIKVAKSVTLKFTGLQPAGLSDVIIRGGPADQNYRLEQIHMHWSQSDNDMGSEHSYNGQTYALEAHMVHHREDLGSVANAANVAHGLLVVGVLFDSTMDDNAGNKGLDSLIQAFTSGDVNVYDRNTTFSNPFNFRSLMPYDFPERYYSYQGSLTTPPCFESVTWVLASTKERISVKQLQAFRDLKYMDNAVGPNFRPMQVQRFRTVFKSFQDSYTSSQRPVYDPTEEPTEEEDNQTPKRDPGVMAMSASGDDNSSWQAVVIAAIVIASCAFTLFLVLLCFFFCRPQMGKRAVAPGENTHRLLERGDTTREEFASRPAPVAAVSSNREITSEEFATANPAAEPGSLASPPQPILHTTHATEARGPGLTSSQPADQPADHPVPPV
eukprot:g77400.t1